MKNCRIVSSAFIRKLFPALGLTLKIVDFGMLWPRSLLSPVSSASRTIAQNILFHYCGTGETPVHDLWYGRLARKSSAVKIFIDNKKCAYSQPWEWILNKVKILIDNKKVARPKHHPNQLLTQYRSIRTASKSRTNKFLLLFPRDVTLIYS